MSRMLTALLELLFPPVCAACGEVLHGGGPFCASCEVSVEPVRAPLCPTCGEPFGGEGPSHPCAFCLRSPPPFEAARAPFLYGGAIRTAIHRYKYGGAWELSRPLSALIAGPVAEFEPRDCDLVVPVPLHRRRLAERGFDQTVPLARAVARAHRLPLRLRALVRSRHTEPQARLQGEARRRNVAGAFAVPRRADVAGRRVLLVDDVLTTGATVRACTLALRGAGAAAVRVLTLSRTPR